MLGDCSEQVSTVKFLDSGENIGNFAQYAPLLAHKPFEQRDLFGQIPCSWNREFLAANSEAYCVAEKLSAFDRAESSARVQCLHCQTVSSGQRVSISLGLSKRQAKNVVEPRPWQSSCSSVLASLCPSFGPPPMSPTFEGTKCSRTS